MRRHLICGLATGLVLALAWTEPALASLDMAELYLRKVRQGERTYFQDGGWGQWRNRTDIFYEGDYILGAGTGDPRFVMPTSEGDPLGAYSVGGIALLSHSRSAYQLSFFTMLSRTFEVDTNNSVFSLLPILAPFAPGAFSKERGVSLTQSVTGFQLRFQPWLQLTYGLLMDERRGQTVFRSFIETNIPVIFFRGNVVPAPASDRIERLQGVFGYDQFTWASNLEVGYLRTDVNQTRNFLYLGFDQVFGMVSGQARMTKDLKLAYADIGLHLSKFDHGDARKNGKFGFAWDVTLKASVVNTREANYWSDALGQDDLQPGYQAEVYFQMPMHAWLGVLTMMITASAAALDTDEKRREKTIEDGSKLALRAFNAADEDDGIYGGMTVGVDYNDPETLREVPGAIGKVHAYFRFRVLY